MLTHRQRILAVARGEEVDRIPWMPRLDLWHNARELSGTLPDKYQGMKVEDIHRAEGWPLHKVIPEYLKPSEPEDIIHRALGLYRLKEFPYDFEFSADVDINTTVEKTDDETMTHVEYHTPVGMVSVRHGITAEMEKSGASITWVKETAIKSRADYKILAHIFGNLKIIPAYERFEAWKQAVGEDGVAVGQGLGIGCSSPMHFIQKTLLEATEFYYHYKDYHLEMAELAEALSGVYQQLIDVLAASPTDAVLWSANVDDMITYPPYFEKEIMPWCLKASEALHAQDKLLIMHPDGENKGLMKLIPRSGVDIADAVTPSPMTKVGIEEYYDQWCRNNSLTIQGGIPECMLLEESTTLDDLKSYLIKMIEVVAPGTRLIASIGDTTPPNADFSRLLYISEFFDKHGNLPLKAVHKPAGGKKPVRSPISQAPVKPGIPSGFELLQVDVLQGDHVKIIQDVRDQLEKGVPAQDILNKGMLPAMEVISTRFKDGSVFIPEVLLSARVMNEALTVLEPHLAGLKMDSPGKIIIGTVHGDLHDIGKNIVLTMLKGVGFEIIDLGVNVKTEEFIRQTERHQPDVLAISALLTTTMPQMEKITRSLQEAGMSQDVKVIVGGAPVNQKFADDIGADGYAKDAGDAVDLVNRMISLSKG